MTEAYLCVIISAKEFSSKDKKKKAVVKTNVPKSFANRRQLFYFQ